MAVQVNPITQSLPATTAIQDPATRRFAQAVEDALRALRSEEGAVESLKKAADAMNNAVAGGTPPSIAQWLFSSELYQKLTTEIARVDTQAKQDVLDEALARSQAIQEIQAALAEIESTPAYDPATTYQIGDLVTYDNKLYRAKAETTGNLPTNTTYWDKVGDYASLGDVVAAHTLQLSEIESDITDIGGDLAAEITARDTLATQLRGTYAGTDVEMVSQGLLYSERQARVTANDVTVSNLNALRAQVGVTEAGALTEGFILNEQTIRNTNDLAIVSAVNTALAQITGVSTSISQSGENLIANWTTAQAYKWSQIEAEVLTAGGQTIRAALQQESNARSTLAGQVSASWMVKAEVDVGTGKPYVAGIALGAEGQGGAATSEFNIRADKFAMFMPGYGEHVPFAIGPSGASFVGAQNTGGVAQPFEGWDLGSQSLVTVSDGKVGGTVLRLGTTYSFPTQTSFVPIDPTKKYRVRFWARPSSDCNGFLYFALRQAVNETGTWGPINNGRSPIKPGGQSRAAHNTTYGTDAWGEYSYIWDAADWQVGVKFFRPEFRNNYTGTVGYWEVQGLVIEEATDVEAAKGAASAAQTAANTANNALADIAADSKLTPAEKQSIRKEWDAIYAERAGIRAQADSFGITTEKTNYDNDFQALGTYLNGGTAYTIGATPPSWITDANLATTTTIVGATFRANWSNLYANRQALLNKISAEAAKRADWAVISGVGKPEDGATVGANDSNYTGSRGNNLLRNSMLKDSTAGWGYALGPGCTLGEFRTALNENGVPKGYGALKLGFSGTASSAYESQVYCGDLAVPCVPGERIELGARVGVYRGDAQLTASFLLSDGSFTLYVPVTGGVSEATNQTAWTQNLSDLQHLWGFVTAPTNAVKCYMEVRVKRTTTAAPTDLYIALPYIGKAGAAQTTHSPWNQGVFITPSEITTWIANLAVQRAQIGYEAVGFAQIGDLEVGTLKIAGNAVTVPLSASGANLATVYSNIEPFTIFNLTGDYNTTARLLFIGHVNAHNTGGSARVRVRFVINGSWVIYDGFAALGPGMEDAFMFSTTVDVPSGVHSFQMQIGQNWTGGPWNCVYASFAVWGTKK